MVLARSMLSLVCALGAVSAALAEGPGAGSWVVRGRLIGIVPDESGPITPIGGKANAENTVVPELDVTYYFTDEIAAEVIAAVTKHDVVAEGTTLGNVPLGDGTILPPTLTLQWHPVVGGNLRPYAGAGVNYSIFLDADPAGGAVTALSFGDSFGPAVQAGIDIDLNDRWMFNIDVKKVWLNTKVKVNGGAIRGDVDLDPWIIGAGFGYRF